MQKIFIPLFLFLFLTAVSLNSVFAQSNLLPKYGSKQKNDAQLTADKKFLADIDQYYKGDRKKAAEDTASRGWQSFRQGDTETAMKRFNQAWLIDNMNGTALWGMAAIEGKAGKMKESLQLFSEAEQYKANDIDFAVDHTRAIGFAGLADSNESLIKDALTRFDRLYKRAPQHVLNLQNWAIVLFYTGDYAGAWKKIKLVEAAPRAGELDKNFVAALEKKMPRPR